MHAVNRRLDTHIQRLRTAITSDHLRAATPHSYTAVMRNFQLIRRLSRTIGSVCYIPLGKQDRNYLPFVVAALYHRLTMEDSRRIKIENEHQDEGNVKREGHFINTNKAKCRGELNSLPDYTG